MKVQVLFDESGKIHAMLHPAAETKTSKETSGKRPVAVLRPMERQRLATLDVPAELLHLKPMEIHGSVRVDLSGGSPRLVANPK